MTGAAGVAQRLGAVRERIAAACAGARRRADEVELLAVSKTHPAQAVREAFGAGQRAFGENRVQELVAKEAALRDLAGVQWHLIGSLQTNKARDLLRVPGLVLVHSLDREKLADVLQQELARAAGDGGERADRSLPVLLQIHATAEPSKHGCPPVAAPALLDHVQRECPRLHVQGLMAMGPLDGDPAPVFAAVASLRDELRARSGLPLAVLSLGMSGDLEAAIAAGSTLVRVGTAIFGERDAG